MQSPAIVKILDHSNPGDDYHYYVMEAFEGAKSLKRLIGTNNNPFAGDPVAAVGMFHSLCDALCECETQGIIHRDLSPGNVLVLPNGSISLIDFGICQIEGGDRITLSDEGVGTPNYMSPECESGMWEHATIGADIYSAGKILWSAITNRMAFAREEPSSEPFQCKTSFPRNH